MRLYLSLYYRQFLLGTLIATLALWAITASWKATTAEPRFSIILANEDGIHLIKENDIPTNTAFLQNFILAYVGYCYNYSASTFDHNIRKCGDLMSQALWNEKQSDITRTANSIRSEAFIQSTMISGEPKVQDDGKIVLTVLSSRFEKKDTLNIKVRVHLTIRRIPLREENLYGYEVTNAEENQI